MNSAQACGYFYLFKL